MVRGLEEGLEGVEGSRLTLEGEEGVDLLVGVGCRSACLIVGLLLERLRIRLRGLILWWLVLLVLLILLLLLLGILGLLLLEALSVVLLEVLSGRELLLVRR